MSFRSVLFGMYTVGGRVGDRFICVWSSMLGLDQWQGHIQYSIIRWFFRALVGIQGAWHMGTSVFSFSFVVPGCEYFSYWRG
jgi:hypothetical protein